MAICGRPPSRTAALSSSIPGMRRPAPVCPPSVERSLQSGTTAARMRMVARSVAKTVSSGSGGLSGWRLGQRTPRLHRVSARPGSRRCGQLLPGHDGLPGGRRPYCDASLRPGGRRSRISIICQAVSAPGSAQPAAGSDAAGPVRVRQQRQAASHHPAAHIQPGSTGRRSGAAGRDRRGHTAVTGAGAAQHAARAPAGRASGSTIW